MRVELCRDGTSVVVSGDPWRRGIGRLVHPSGRSVDFLSPALSGHHFFTGEWPRPRDAVDYEPHESPGDLRASGDRTAVWHQPPTPTTLVETRIAYEIAGPGSVEARFDTRSHAASYPFGYVSLFWATIVPHGGQRGFHLLVREKDGAVRWQYRPGGGDCWTCRANTFLGPDAPPAAHSPDHPPTYFLAEASERFALPLWVVRWKDLSLTLEVDSLDVAFTNVLLATAIGGPSHDVYWRLRPRERRSVRVRLTVAPWDGWRAVEERYRAWDGCVDRSFTAAPRPSGAAFPRLLPPRDADAASRETPGAGLARSRRLFETRGRSLLEETGLLDRCAVACLGGTSQNAGVDDETSRDHWWGPYLTFLLPEDVPNEQRARLERAVAAMPDEADGVSWVGYGGPTPRRTRVTTFLAFLRTLTGLESRPRDDREWLPYLTRASFLGRRWLERLFDATQGTVFHDPCGRFTDLWRHWTGYVPPDVHRALLARALFRTWNAGPEYNLARLHRRGDRLGFQLYLARFADDVLELAFCWNERFVPQPKWRAVHFRALPICPSGIALPLESLWEQPDAAAQLAATREIVAEIKQLMRDLYHLAVAPQRPLSAYAHAVHRTIRDGDVRQQTTLDW